MPNFNEAFRLIQVNRISVIDFNERCTIHNPQVAKAWIQINITILVLALLCSLCSVTTTPPIVVLNVGEDLHLAWRGNWLDGFIRSAALSLPPARRLPIPPPHTFYAQLNPSTNPTRYCNGIHRSKFRPAIRRCTPHRLGLSGQG